MKKSFSKPNESKKRLRDSYKLGSVYLNGSMVIQKNHLVSLKNQKMIKGEL